MIFRVVNVATNELFQDWATSSEHWKISPPLPRFRRFAGDVEHVAVHALPVAAPR